MQYFNDVLQIFPSVLNWIVELDLHFSFLGACASIFALYTVYRFILAPLIGEFGSDTYQNFKKQNNINIGKSRRGR